MVELYGACVLAGECRCGLCGLWPDRKDFYEMMAQQHVESMIFMQQLDALVKEHDKIKKDKTRYVDKRRPTNGGERV